MSTVPRAGEIGQDRMRRAAWVLLAITITFWLWFGIGSAYTERAGLFNWMMHILVPAGIFLVSALVAWRREVVGGIVLILEGLVAYGLIGGAWLAGRLPDSTLVLMSLTLGFPPLVAGILFVSCWRRARSSG